MATANAIRRGISLFGLETEFRNVMCTWQHDVPWLLNKLESLGFNTIRIPFSYDYVHTGDWSVLDDLFHHIQETNLSAVLDFHRIDDTHQSPKPWIEGKVDFEHFLQAWNTVLQRYGTNPRLTGLDIFNEYQGDNYVEWNNIARQIVSYIDSSYGKLNLTYYVQGTNWGGNIHFLNLEDMECSDRVRYTIHKYHFSDKEPLEDNWSWSFGLADHATGKINVGEWGFISDHPNEVDWARRFVAWLKLKGIRDSFFWCASPNSFDTGGILLDDCSSVDCRKMKILRDYWSD